LGRLEGKRTLITGGTTGIGLETAKRFVEEGARVAITGTNPKTLEAAQKELSPGCVRSLL
jgi:NAD(P)-dependent dehydrogenase (short-subunit alcohol dehydrogenase family)